MKLTKDEFFSMLERGEIDNFTINGRRFFASREENLEKLVKSGSKLLPDKTTSIAIAHVVRQYKEIIEKRKLNSNILPNELVIELNKLNKKDLEDLLNQLGSELYSELRAQGKNFERWFAELSPSEQQKWEKEEQLLKNAYEKKDKPKLRNLYDKYKTLIKKPLENLYTKLKNRAGSYLRKLGEILN